MNGFLQAENEALLDSYECEAEELGTLSFSAGTFSLRRANYLGETWKQFLNPEQVRMLTSLILESDPVTKQQILVHNVRKVLSIAKHYTNRGLGHFDLVNAGITGLIHAMEKFDLAGGFRFSVYATKCICRNIERALMNQNHPVESLQAEPGWISYDSLTMGAPSRHIA